MDAVSSGVSSSFTGRRSGSLGATRFGVEAEHQPEISTISPNSVPEHDDLTHTPAPPLKMVNTILVRGWPDRPALCHVGRPCVVLSSGG